MLNYTNTDLKVSRWVQNFCCLYLLTLELGQVFCYLEAVEALTSIIELLDKSRLLTRFDAYRLWEYALWILLVMPKQN